jgi:hypothetical protein
MTQNNTSPACPTQSNRAHSCNEWSRLRQNSKDPVQVIITCTEYRPGFQAFWLKDPSRATASRATTGRQDAEMSQMTRTIHLPGSPFRPSNL